MNFPDNVLHLRRVLSDPDAFGDVVSGIHLAVDFQRRLERPSMVEQFQTPAWGLDFGEVHAKTTVRGVMPPGWASVCLMDGRAHSKWNGHEIDNATLCSVPPGEELDGTTTPGFSWMTVALPMEAWAQCRTVAGLEDHQFHRFTAGRLSLAQLARFQSHSQTARRLLRDAPERGREAAARLVMELATTMCEMAVRIPEPRDSLRNRRRLARRAETWMREHLSQPVRVPDVCLALRVSRRELEYAFRGTFDQSPRDFLHGLRLHRARRILLEASEERPVLEIALACGLAHASRFSADYRLLFGENPSQTTTTRQR